MKQKFLKAFPKNGGAMQLGLRRTWRGSMSLTWLSVTLPRFEEVPRKCHVAAVYQIRQVLCAFHAVPRRSVSHPSGCVHTHACVLRYANISGIGSSGICGLQRPTKSEPRPGAQSDYKSLISYYLREGFYQHAADEATEQINRRGNDTYLLYWKGEVPLDKGVTLALCNDKVLVLCWAPISRTMENTQGMPVLRSTHILEFRAPAQEGYEGTNQALITLQNSRRKRNLRLFP